MRDWKLHLPVALLAGWVLVHAAYFYRFGEPHQTYRDYFVGTIKLVIAWGGLYCVGLAFTASKGFRAALVVLVFLMAAAVPLLVQTPAMSLDYTQRAGWNVASYQFFANALAVPAIVALALSWRTRWEPVVAAVPLVAMFYMLSRSELAGMAAVFAGWLFLCVLHRRFATAAAGFGALAGTAAIAFAITALAPVHISIETPQWVTDARTAVEAAKAEAADGSAGDSAAARQSEIFNLEASESWGERSVFFWTGIDDIARSPIFGDYAGQIRDHQKAGTYIHNILSVWRQYGIVPFLLFAGLCLWGVAICFRRLIIERTEDPMWILTGMMVGYTVLLMVATKSVFWPLPALAWGLVAARLSTWRK